jgi:hypothetical protein
MQPVCEELSAFHTTSARDVAGALAALAAAQASPDLVVACQSWPDEYPPDEVDELIARLPVARWICCFGLWCEAIGRTRSAWPLATCVPARNAASRIRAETEVIGGTRNALPVTASRDETFAFDFDPPLPRTARSRCVLVSSPERALADWINESLTGAGHTIAKSEDATSLDAIVWDADPWTARRASLDALRDAHGDSRIIAVAGFAPPELVAELIEAGAECVLPKLDASRAILSALEA